MSTTSEADTAGFADRTAWARSVAAPVRDFLGTETGGASVLLGGAVVALVWANSPWSHSYESLWATKLSIANMLRYAPSARIADIRTGISGTKCDTTRALGNA